VIARAKALSAELGTTITPGFEALVFKASRGIEDIYDANKTSIQILQEAAEVAENTSCPQCLCGESASRSFAPIRGTPHSAFVFFVCFVVNNPPSVLIREIRGFRFLKFGCGGTALGVSWANKAKFRVPGSGLQIPTTRFRRRRNLRSA
jgi:hypothetical protein